MSNHAEGPANWKIPVGPLSEDDADLRWRWLTPAEHQRFEELADIDIEAYLELSNRIEAASKGLLNPDDTSISLVNHPLGRRRSKWPGQSVPWIAGSSRFGVRS